MCTVGPVLYSGVYIPDVLVDPFNLSMFHGHNSRVRLMM